MLLCLALLHLRLHILHASEQYLSTQAAISFRFLQESRVHLHLGVVTRLPRRSEGSTVVTADAPLIASIAAGFCARTASHSWTIGPNCRRGPRYADYFLHMPRPRRETCNSRRPQAAQRVSPVLGLRTLGRLSCSACQARLHSNRRLLWTRCLGHCSALPQGVRPDDYHPSRPHHRTPKQVRHHRRRPWSARLGPRPPGVLRRSNTTQESRCVVVHRHSDRTPARLKDTRAQPSAIPLATSSAYCTLFCAPADAHLNKD